jgi:hypothetical protein
MKRNGTRKPRRAGAKMHAGAAHAHVVVEHAHQRGPLRDRRSWKDRGRRRAWDATLLFPRGRDCAAGQGGRHAAQRGRARRAALLEGLSGRGLPERHAMACGRGAEGVERRAPRRGARGPAPGAGAGRAAADCASGARRENPARTSIASRAGIGACRQSSNSPVRASMPCAGDRRRSLRAPREPGARSAGRRMSPSPARRDDRCDPESVRGWRGRALRARCSARPRRPRNAAPRRPELPLRRAWDRLVCRGCAGARHRPAVMANRLSRFLVVVQVTVVVDRACVGSMASAP